MNIREFVNTAITEIIKGVEDAGTFIATKAEFADGASVNPIRPGARKVNNIDFDIAVTVSDTKGGRGGITVLGVGIEGGGSTERSSISRIKFQVPVRFPYDTEAVPHPQPAEDPAPPIDYPDSGSCP